MTTEYRSPHTTLTISLGSLASSGTLVAGQCSAPYSNATNKDDYVLPHLVAVAGTVAPTAGGQIEVWCFAKMPDGNWPALFTVAYAGADVARSVVNRDILQAGAILVGSVTNDNVASRVYPIQCRELSTLRWGYVPTEVSFWVTQSTGQALATSGHALTLQAANTV
jgi:hypothetical protein